MTNNTVLSGEAKPSKRESLNRLLSSEIDGYDPGDDEGSAGMLMDYVNRGIDDKKKFYDAITKDPRLAQVLSDVVAGKRSAGAAFARYFGRDLMNAEEGTAEYDEIMKAEEERRAELDLMKKRDADYKANVEKSLPLLEQKCKEAGIDVDDFLEKAWDQVVNPIASGNVADAFDILYHGFSYEKDVNDAMAAGEVRGRNKRIQQMRENRGDGMPKGMGSAIPTDKKSGDYNPLLSAALKA